MAKFLLVRTEILPDVNLPPEPTLTLEVEQLVNQLWPGLHWHSRTSIFRLPETLESEIRGMTKPQWISFMEEFFPALMNGHFGKPLSIEHCKGKGRLLEMDFMHGLNDDPEIPQGEMTISLCFKRRKGKFTPCLINFDRLPQRDLETVEEYEGGPLWIIFQYVEIPDVFILQDSITLQKVLVF